MNARKHIALSLLAFVCIQVHADKLTDAADKVMQWPVIGLIYPTYAPETNWSFCAGIQGTFTIPGAPGPSSITSMGGYTLNHQWRVQSVGYLYMGGKTPWALQYEFQYRDYPDEYYGIGNTEKPCYNYDSRRANFQLQPMVSIANYAYLGPLVDFLWETTNLNHVNPDYKGRDKTLMWGLGFVSQLDTRDFTYYPSKGIMCKFYAAYYEPKLGSDYRMCKLDLDFRHYVTLWKPKDEKDDFKRINKSLIFAYEFKGTAALSGDPIADMPFQMMSTIGGQDLVRGVRSNMFRDNVLLALQGELRFPIYSILRGTLFAGIGDVYNTDNWNWTTPKVGYGLGLRLAVNKAHIDIRFDVARNNLEKDWSDAGSYSFYITAREAF